MDESHCIEPDVNIGCWLIFIQFFQAEISGNAFLANLGPFILKIFRGSMPMDPLEGKKNISSPLRGLGNLFESGTAPPPPVQKASYGLNVSVNSKPDHPPGNFFDGRIPHPRAKKFKIPPPGPIKTSWNPTPGPFSSIIHNKNMKKWDKNHEKLRNFIIFRWFKDKLGLQLRPRLHLANLLW